MDHNTINALWLVGAGLAGGTVKPIFDYLTGRGKERMDQLQLAISTAAKAQSRSERLEGKIAGQAFELDKLRRQLVGIEAQRDRLQEDCTELRAELEAVRASQAALAEANEQLAAEQETAAAHVEALAQQVKALGQEPTPAPAPRTKRKR